MSGSFGTFVVLFVFGLAIRIAYERYKIARNVHEVSRPAFIAVFAGMALLWVSWFSMCPRDPFRLPLPDGARWTGLALVVVGWILALGALAQLRGVENIDHLVTSGLFSKLRHPMYTGFVLWIVGWATYHAAGASLLAGLLAIVNVQHWRHLEEVRLETAYGEAYRAYRDSTWF